MRQSRSRRCALCQKLHPSAEDARECESLPRPTSHFQVGDIVYPRFTGITGAMQVCKSRIVRGTHAVEHALRPEGARSGRFVWVDDRYVFRSAEERDQVRTAEKRPPRRKTGRTASAKSSYTRAFRLNREMAEKRRGEGKCVVVYRCASSNHGRPMKFFATAKRSTVRCPACGADQKVPAEGGRVAVQFVEQEGSCE